MHELPLLSAAGHIGLAWEPAKPISMITSAARWTGHREEEQHSVHVPPTVSGTEESKGGCFALES